MAQLPDNESVAPGTAVGSALTLGVERFVAGGLGLAHDPDGRVVLVEGGLPGDEVVAEVTASKKRLLQARVVDVLIPGHGRIAPPCPEVERGCGGCDLQHVASEIQIDLKTQIVIDSLRRIARLSDVEVRAGQSLSPFGYRTSVRCMVDRDSGRLGFRRARSHQIHVVDQCMIAHPLADEIINDSRFPGADEVTIRVGAATGERLVIVSGETGEYEVPEGVTVCVTQSHHARGGHKQGRRQRGVPDGHFHEVVAGHRFRISAASFFQARPDGAEALVDSVRRALGEFDPTVDTLADLYGGVGLFAAGLGAHNGYLVESSGSAVADAKVNLEATEMKINRSKVEAWKPTTVDAVVADPARRGLDKDGARVVLATGAHNVALVSCDPASMARDVALLVEGGYDMRWVEVIDMFPQTHHVETVASLVKVG